VTTARAIGPILASVLIGWWGGAAGMLWLMAGFCLAGAAAILVTGGRPGRAP
jgi:hypothetical protein